MHADLTEGFREDRQTGTWARFDEGLGSNIPLLRDPSWNYNEDRRVELSCSPEWRP